MITIEVNGISVSIKRCPHCIYGTARLVYINGRVAGHVRRERRLRGGREVWADNRLCPGDGRAYGSYSVSEQPTDARMKAIRKVVDYAS